METPTVGEFCWNELATTDVDAAKAFYSTVFGWKFNDVAAGDTQYTMVLSKDKQVAGLWKIPEEKAGTIPSHWMSYILVDDIQASFNKAKEQGAQVIKEITPVEDFGKLAIFIDPTGAHIAIWQSSQQAS